MKYAKAVAGFIKIAPLPCHITAVKEISFRQWRQLYPSASALPPESADKIRHEALWRSEASFSWQVSVRSLPGKAEEFSVFQLISLSPVLSLLVGLGCNENHSPDPIFTGC
ncbi:MAG: hypothetical protein MZV63_71680 [Marinilabiliales bacterium]|nr:hypothetical protein [Marinilabiliales bacterium]